ARQVDQLSTAARQRVAVARALVRAPELLIADQPTSAQDAEGAELVCGAISDAASRGTACLVLGKDPALRAIAERDGWRQLALVHGELRPMAEIVRAGVALDDLLVDEPGFAGRGSAAEWQRGVVDVGSAPVARDPMVAEPVAAAEPVAPIDPVRPIDLVDASNIVPFPVARSAGAR
ncbi:MAG TPA: ATP-binding cassette domain-containing protein, partial [Kofleriaceae bacterium]|nr:ATP-binding cassette domain-containing protein [Kofleriaceae bacterium]